MDKAVPWSYLQLCQDSRHERRQLQLLLDADESRKDMAVGCCCADPLVLKMASAPINRRHPFLSKYCQEMLVKYAMPGR